MPLFVIIAYIIIMGAVFVFRLLPEVYVEAFNDGVIAVVCLVGSYHLFRVFKRFQSGDSARISWLMFAIGLLGEGVGHVWYCSQEFIHGEVESFPNMADTFIMAGAICYIISFWNFNRQLKSVELIKQGSTRWLANSIFFVLVLLNCAFIIYPTLSDPEEALWLRVLYIYYPVFDMFLAYFCLHLALSFLTLGQSPVAKPWAVLVIAFMIFLVTDSAYAYFEVLGTYHPYMLINPGWGLAYLCVSHAAYLQYKLMGSMQSIQIDANFWDDSDDDGPDIFASV